MERVYDILRSDVSLRMAWLRDCEGLSFEILQLMASEKASFLTKWAQEEIERRESNGSKDRLS